MYLKHEKNHVGERSPMAQWIIIPYIKIPEKKKRKYRFRVFGEIYIFHMLTDRSNPSCSSTQPLSFYFHPSISIYFFLTSFTFSSLHIFQSFVIYIFWLRSNNFSLLNISGQFFILITLNLYMRQLFTQHKEVEKANYH